MLWLRQDEKETGEESEEEGQEKVTAGSNNKKPSSSLGGWVFYLWPVRLVRCASLTHHMSLRSLRVAIELVGFCCIFVMQPMVIGINSQPMICGFSCVLIRICLLHQGRHRFKLTDLPSCL
jgi:hypothetical protein